MVYWFATRLGARDDHLQNSPSPGLADEFLQFDGTQGRIIHCGIDGSHAIRWISLDHLNLRHRALQRILFGG